MAIENRDLPVGTRLEATYKKTRYVCVVEAGEEGKLVFVLEDGKRFSSPSAAASAVMGGQAANGWRFWSVEGSEPKAARAKTEPKAKAARGSKKASSKTATRPKRNGREAHAVIQVSEHQEDIGEGEVRYWCNACMASFIGFAGAAPEQCPEGHRNDDPELTANVATLQAEATAEAVS